jgi:undecaprenyl-diphosphatase
MIEWYQAIILALVQGLTEFLPISSSAHLAISPILLGWPDQGLAFDIAVHVGTLSAVLLYYRKDLQNMAGSWFSSLVGGKPDSDSRLVWYLTAATVPVAIVGVMGSDFIGNHLRSLGVIASTTLLFGLLLGWADKRARSPSPTVAISLSLALLIGLAQALAPIPGVSRSGVTITAALLLGMDRQSSARFSFLLSIPVIASAGCMMAVELPQSGEPVAWLQLAVAAAISGVTAFLCIGLFIRLLDRVGLMPFVYYRVFLAAVLYLLMLV